MIRHREIDQCVVKWSGADTAEREGKRERPGREEVRERGRGSMGICAVNPAGVWTRDEMRELSLHQLSELRVADACPIHVSAQGMKGGGGGGGGGGIEEEDDDE